MRLEPGTVIGNDFLIERFLKGGGMGEVYVARQLSTEKLRALKLMKAELTRDPRSQERFKQEAKVAAKIDSTHIVEVVSAGIDDKTGRPWLAMELLNGDDLRTYVEKHGLVATSALLRLFEQLGRALGKAHEAGIIHRDLKPENVFLSEAREPGQPFMVKVLDFGIAKIVADYNSRGDSTVQIGTPLWMAMEQTDSATPITPTADIWPLGLMAFWLLTGRYYWRAAEKPQVSVLAIMREVVTGPYDPPSKRAAELGCSERIPVGFDEWFFRCVHRDPAQRFASAPEAAAELALVLQAHRISQRGEPPFVTPGHTDSLKGAILSPTPRVTSATGRRPVISLLLASGLGVSALVGIILGVLHYSLERARGLCTSNKVSLAERTQSCMQACDKGSIQYCMNAGESQLILRAGTRGGGKDAKRAFRTACENKQPGACSRLAKLLYNGEGGEWSDPQQALDVYLSSCDGGELKDCVTAGSLLLAGERTRSDPNQARELFKLACDKGLGAGCGELGKVLMQGKGGSKDENKAVSYFQQGCDHGDGTSCVAYAHALAEGRIFQKKDEAGAFVLYAKGCESGAFEGCAYQAEFLRTGRGTARDEGHAAKLFVAASEKQVPLGVFGVAHYELDGGAGIVKNAAHAEEQLVVSCKKDHFAVACWDLGQAYQKGVTLKASREKALEYSRLACQGGIKEACTDSPPVPGPPPPPCPNLERINARCEAGEGDACVRLGQMYEKGRCTPKNLCEGHRQYNVGCKIHKHEPSCVMHKHFHEQSYGNQCGG